MKAAQQKMKARADKHRREVVKGGLVVIQQKSIVDSITMATEHVWQQNQAAGSMISYQACEDKVCSLPALQGLLAAK